MCLKDKKKKWDKKGAHECAKCGARSKKKKKLCKPSK